MGRPKVHDQPRDGRPGFVVRLDPEIVELLRQKIGKSERGRGGGIAHYLRTLLYADLGLDPPEPWAAEVSPRRKPNHEKSGN
jgi:hypothetical protein